MEKEQEKNNKNNKETRKPMRVMIEIEGVGMIDTWHIKSVDLTEVWSDDKNDYVPAVIFNKDNDTMENEWRAKIVEFNSFDERKDFYDLLKIKLQNVGIIVI